MFKKIFFAILLLVFAFFLPVKTFAADLNVTCSSTSSGCTMTGLSPLFSLALDGYWYPGRTISKTINIKNIGTGIKQIGLRATETTNSTILKQVMKVNIGSNGMPIWEGSLDAFYNQNTISLGTLNPGQDKNFNFSVRMIEQTNDDYQGLETVFDLTLGFWGEVDNSARISGFKYFDFNRNNQWDGWYRGEFKMNGWMIFIDKNNNKKYDRGERFDVTNGFYFPQGGTYSFDKLSAGSYNICENQMYGWESSLAGHATCQIITLASGQNKTDVNFGNNFIQWFRR
jgi:hypothetical protein